MTEAAQLAARPAHDRPRPTFEDSAALHPRSRYRARGAAQGPGRWRDRRCRSGFLASSCSRSWPRAGRPSAQAYVKLDITFDAAVIDPGGTRDPATLAQANYAELITAASEQLFPDATSRQDRRVTARSCVSSGAAARAARHGRRPIPSLIGQTKEVWLVAGRRGRPVRQGPHRPRLRPRPTAASAIADSACSTSWQARAGCETRLQPHLLHHAATRASPSSPASRRACGARPT